MLWPFTDNFLETDEELLEMQKKLDGEFLKSEGDESLLKKQLSSLNAQKSELETEVNVLIEKIATLKSLCEVITWWYRLRLTLYAG